MVQPKDSTAPLSWRNAGAVMEVNRASIQELPAVNDQTVYSYQQINCLDSVIRYTCVEFFFAETFTLDAEARTG